MTPSQRARKCANILSNGDAASHSQGMELIDVNEGTATMRMTVKPMHINGHGICHGGVSFMLADSAFAFACNSRNCSTVAQFNSITYIVAAASGTR